MEKLSQEKSQKNTRGFRVFMKLVWAVVLVSSVLLTNTSQAQGTQNNATEKTKVASSMNLQLDLNAQFSRNYTIQVGQYTESDMNAFCKSQSDYLVVFTYNNKSKTLNLEFPESPEGAVSLNSVAEQNWYLGIKCENFNTNVLPTTK